MTTSKTQVTLTENEIAAVKMTLNYDDRANQHADNYSNAGMDEMTAELGWNKHQVAALMGSLEAKGIGSYDEDDDLFWLTSFGVDTIFDIIDAEQQQAA
jgi:hypothetical protein